MSVKTRREKKMKHDLRKLGEHLRNASVQGYESENYQEELEAFNIIDYKRGGSMPQKAVITQKGERVMVTQTGLAQASPLGSGIKAQFDVQISRTMFGNGSGLPNLEAPVFGYANSKGFFLRNGWVIKPQAIALDPTNGDMVLMFDPLGTLTDYDLVRIHCVQVEYSSLLEMIGSKKFRLAGLRFDVGNTTNLGVMQEQVRERKNSMFGNGSDSSIGLNSFAKGSDYHLTIRDIPLVMDIDQYITLNFPCPQTAEYLNNKGLTYTVSMFVEIFEK